MGAMAAVNKLIHYISTSEGMINKNDYLNYNWTFGKIAYKKYGQGSPLLLIHDLNVCSSSYEWKNVVKVLSESYTVYTIDLLGCGCSDKPCLTYTNYLYVQLITDFIRNVIKEKTDVLCSGDSCPFVVMACANNDTIINRIMMINPSDLVSLARTLDRISKLIRHIMYLPIVGTFIYNMFNGKRRIRSKFNDTYYYNANNVREKDVLTYYESAHRDKIRSRFLYSCQKTFYTNADITHALRKINNPIYIVAGKNYLIGDLIASQYQNVSPSIEIIFSAGKKLLHLEESKDFLDNFNVLFN